VKDVDLGMSALTIRLGKGDKDRVTMVSEEARMLLVDQLARVEALHQRDLATGAGRVALPGALARKIPSADRSLAWQWVFPATRLSLLDGSGHRGRHHLHRSVVQRAMQQAAAQARLSKRATCHTLRHSFDASAGGRVRHPDSAGAAGASGREHDDGVHARAEPGAAGGSESGGSAVSWGVGVGQECKLCHSAAGGLAHLGPLVSQSGPNRGGRRVADFGIHETTMRGRAGWQGVGNGVRGHLCEGLGCGACSASLTGAAGGAS
jgi:hypothetical protein